jgi:acetyl esterase/lipase
MIYKKYGLDEFSYGKLKSKSNVSLTAYIPENFPEMDMERRRKVIIICPGGGYRFVSDREAEPVAIRFMAEDFACFVLKYSIVPEFYPKPQLELCMAIKFIKDNADNFMIDKDDITVMGFSAGGHLAASISVMAQTDEYADMLDLSADDITPSKAILCYPVISTDRAIYSAETFENLFKGLEIDESKSLEKLVNDKTLPTIIWTTKTDQTVPYENSLVFADALKKHNIKHFLKVYDDGVHGLSLANEVTRIKKYENSVNSDVATWPQFCIEKLKELG